MYKYKVFENELISLKLVDNRNNIYKKEKVQKFILTFNIIRFTCKFILCSYLFSSRIIRNFFSKHNIYL